MVKIYFFNTHKIIYCCLIHNHQKYSNFLFKMFYLNILIKNNNKYIEYKQTLFLDFKKLGDF